MIFNKMDLLLVEITNQSTFDGEKGEINPNCVYDKEQPAKLCNLGRTDEWRLVGNGQLRRLFVVG
jgi:hypothetical protein